MPPLRPPAVRARDLFGGGGGGGGGLGEAPFRMPSPTPNGPPPPGGGARGGSGMFWNARPPPSLLLFQCVILQEISVGFLEKVLFGPRSQNFLGIYYGKFPPARKARDHRRRGVVPRPPRPPPPMPLLRSHGLSTATRLTVIFPPTASVAEQARDIFGSRS